MGKLWLPRLKVAHAMPQFPQHGSPAASAFAGIGPVPGDQNYAGWTQPPETCSGNQAAAGVAGTLLLRRIGCNGIQQVTNLFMMIVTAAVGATAGQNFAGLWDGNGNLVGITADQSAAFGGTGLITMPLVNPAAGGLPGPPFLVDTPYLYIGYWWNAATSAPLLTRGTFNGDVNGPGTPAAVATCVTANTGLTTQATAPTKLGALTKVANNVPWFAWN